MSKKDTFYIVTACFNRLRNLKLVYEALKKQTDLDFVWLVCDDGSTDGTQQWVDSLTDSPFPVSYLVSKMENTGYCQAAARNRGCESVIDKALVFWFLDSDVLPYPNAVTLYKTAYQKNPNRVICGEYDWGSPIQISAEDVRDNFEAIINESLPPVPDALPHGMQGRDIRAKEFEGTEPDELHWERNYGLSTFGGNLLVPAHIFFTPWTTTRPNRQFPIYQEGQEVGIFETAKPVAGFDERFTVGIEDGDFGLMTVAKGYPISLHKGVKGYHVWHPRDIPRIQRISQEQVPLLDAKHGIDVEGETETMHRQDYDVK